MTILQGLPASGKSTRAQELLKEAGNVVRINKDLLRKMLHFGKYSGYNESLTRSASRSIARDMLSSGINVLIDDTNLNEGTLQSWKDLAKELKVDYKVITIDTPVDECIKRDKAREDGVGEDVIIAMAMKAGLYPKPKKGIIICDIDGTLADIKHRLHFVRESKKDWKKFFSEISKDTLRQDVVDLVMKYEEEGYEIFLVSGRSQEYKEATEKWLEKEFKGYRFYKALFMRARNDGREDSEVKKDIYDSLFKKYNVYEVIDDRPRVIRMWREQGLNVRDVGDQIEF